MLLVIIETTATTATPCNTYHKISASRSILNLQVRMPTAKELEALDTDNIMEELAGSGNTQLLNTYILAASSITAAVSVQGTCPSASAG